MNKKNILLVIFLGIFAYNFISVDFASAAYLTCGGNKTEADCISAGGTVVTMIAGGCTSCSIPSSTCPAGMTKYLNWTKYTAETCGSNSPVCQDSGGLSANCGTKCKTGSACTTSGSWINSASAPTCSYRIVSETAPYSLEPACTSNSVACGLCGSSAFRGYCFTSSGKVYLRCYSLSNAISHTCTASIGNVACIGSGATPVNPTLNFSLSSSFSTSTATVIKGDTRIFYWKPTNATSCTASKVSVGTEDWTGAKSYSTPTYLQQPVTFNEVGVNRVYELECFNGILSSGKKTVTVDVIYDVTSCTNPSCGSDCGVIKKNYCKDLSGNIAPDSYCGGGAGCADVVCNSCQWKETSP